MAKQSKQESEKTEALFSKEALLKSKEFMHVKDLLAALLVDGNMYTCSDVKHCIVNFQEGRVR